jgi:integrase
VPPKTKQIQTIPPPDVQKIKELLKAEHQVIVDLLLATGIRISTALALTKQDIGEDFINFKNVKVNRVFQFPLTNNIRNILSQLDLPLNSSFERAWYRTTKKLNLRYGIHQLRKTFLSNMANKGLSIDELSAITNTDVKTLRKYYVQMDLKKIGEKL